MYLFLDKFEDNISFITLNLQSAVNSPIHALFSELGSGIGEISFSEPMTGNFFPLDKIQSLDLNFSITPILSLRENIISYERILLYDGCREARSL